jgi:DNA-binding beta-propeller fold protein YncE
MKIRGLRFKIFVVATIAIALVVIGYVVMNKSTLKPSPTHEVAYCHPSRGDLAQDGTMFAALTPDGMAVTVSRFDTDTKASVIKLSRPAHDILLLGNQELLLSYGSTGEVGLLNVGSEQPEQSFKIGQFAGDMCRTASQALVSDSISGKIYQFDPATKSVSGTHSVAGKPAHMKWIVPDAELAVFDAEGKSLGTIQLARKLSVGE